MSFIRPFMGFAGVDSKTASKRNRPHSASPPIRNTETKVRNEAGEYEELFLRWNHSPRIDRRNEVQMLYGHDVSLESLRNGPSRESRRIPETRVKSAKDLRQEAIDLFRLYDKDGSDSLDLVEFKKLLRDAGLGGDMLFRQFSEYVKRDFNTIDTDGNHSVDLEEFVAYYLHVNMYRLAAAVRGQRGARESPPKTSAQRKMEILRTHVHTDFAYTPSASKICWLRKTLQAQTKHLAAAGSSKIMSLDEACHLGSVPAARSCIEDRGETICFGGVPPIVRATLNSHFDLVA